MRRLTAMLIAATMMFALGCEPPAADDGGGDTDPNTTMIDPNGTPSLTIEGEGVQLVSLKLPGMS